MLLLTGVMIAGLLVGWWVNRPEDPHAADAPGSTAGAVAASFGQRLEAARQRVAVAPLDTSALLELARLLQDAHRSSEAIPYFERALAAAPDSRAMRLDLGAAYGSVGRWSDARAHMRALLDASPGDAEALYNLGAIAANRSDTAEAERWWRRAAEAGDSALAAAARAALARLGR